MSSQRHMADDLSRMAARFQSATYPFPPPPPPPPRPTEQSRARDASSTGARQPAMWSFMGSFNGFNSEGGRWVSESHSESWVNGQRQSTHKRRDANVRIIVPSSSWVLDTNEPTSCQMKNK